MVGRMAWGALCNAAPCRKSHFSLKNSWNREIRQIREWRGFAKLGLPAFRVELPVRGNGHHSSILAWFAYFAVQSDIRRVNQRQSAVEKSLRTLRSFAAKFSGESLVLPVPALRR
jgi:hypothetical protein